MTGETLTRIALYGGGIYLLANLYALLFSNRHIFAPMPTGYSHLPNELKITTGSGEKITAVYLEHPQAEYTILFSHGNAEDLSKVLPFMQQYRDRGYSVLLYDYRGYGTSDGTPSVTKAKQDVDAAYRWLTEEKEVDPKRIISHGRSLGGGPAAWLAATHPVGGLVIESSFVSTFRVKTRWPLLPWDKFNSLRAIRKADCPVLIIHGRLDTVIPFWHAEKLYAAVPGPKMNLWIDTGRHNDYAYEAGADYAAVFDEFIGLVKSQ